MTAVDLWVWLALLAILCLFVLPLLWSVIRGIGPMKRWFSDEKERNEIGVAVLMAFIILCFLMLCYSGCRQYYWKHLQFHIPVELK